MKLGPNRKTHLREKIEDVELGEGITLRPTQQAFASSPCRHKAYIGPLGSGKSLVLCLVCLILASSIPGNAGVIGRYSRFDFNRTTRVRLEALLPEALVERQLPNGEGWVIRTSDPDKPSTLWTAHYDEAGPYASMDLGFFGIDEVNGDDLSPSVPEEVYNMLVARLGRLSHVRRPYGLLCGNPLGHNWVWKKFHHDSADRLLDHEMFTPKPYENAENLTAGYYERLEKTMGAEWVARYVEGSHDVFEGQVYPELSWENDTVNPFEIPPAWPRIIALDHGMRNPTAAGFLAINEDGVIFAYDEHYEAGKPISYHAEKISQRITWGCGWRNRERDKEKVQPREVRWPADPSIFAKTMQKAGKTYSVFDEYAEEGLDQWEPGENDVAAGRNRIKEHLKAGKLKFFRGRVPNLWREMTQLHWQRLRSLQDRNTPEREADKDNHSPDYLRYALMTRPEPAEKPATVEAPKSPGRRLGDRAAKAYRQAVKQRQRQEEGEADYV